MTTDEDWRAPGTPAAPSPVLTDAIERLEAAYDALFSIAPTTLSDEDLNRLACEARIVPAVLGGRSEVLDLGRTRRFHTRAQRLAIAQRDGGCTAEGCDLPPPPPRHPRRALRDHQTPQRQGQLPPTNVGRQSESPARDPRQRYLTATW